MNQLFALAMVFVMMFSSSVLAQEQFEKDVLSTSAGDLGITFIGHGTLMFTFNEKVIHVDPFGKMADYSQLPKADMILLTHHHRDHFDPKALELIRTDSTKILLTEACAEQLAGGIIMKNGDIETVEGLKVEAVPAYNLVHKQDNGEPD